jgi:hypothetical protein
LHYRFGEGVGSHADKAVACLAFGQIFLDDFFL